MFLISLVALLAFVSVARADEYEWDGGGDGVSWDDPDNWDPTGVPGSADFAKVVDPNADYDVQHLYPVVDSDVNVNQFGGPAFEQGEDVNQVMTIDGVTFTINSPETEENWIRDGDFGGDDADTSYWVVRLINGARFEIPNGGVRLFDHGKGRLSLEDDSSFYVNGECRAADEDDGYMWVVTTGTSTIDIGEDLFLGDDGGGCFDFGGNSIITVGRNFFIPGRKEEILGMKSLMNIRDSAVLNAAGVGVHASKEGEVTMNVYGGTVNADFLRIACKVCKDEEPEGTGSVFVHNGTVNICGDISVPDFDDEDATALLEQTGGEINCCTLVVKDNGTVNLLGGVCNVGSVPDCTCSSGLDLEGGVINIAGGTLVLVGDQCAAVADLEASGLMGGYWTDIGGGCAGFRAKLVCVYDPGTDTTTVTADAPNAFKAWSPYPATGAVAVSVDVILTWCEGDCLLRNSVYLGTDPVAVENATTANTEWKGYRNPGIKWLDPDTAPSNPIALQLWTTYYWRVDEYHKPAGCYTTPPALTKGDIWSFTPGCELIEGDINLDCVVNFLDYAMMADDWTECVFFPDDVVP
jgi:hypothetical protein